jgi:hypothetical protein
MKSQNKDSGCKLFKRYMIKPTVIYLKNKRDNMLISTEKKDKMPQDEYGYFGGFSPSRENVYTNGHLVRQYREEAKAQKEAQAIKLQQVQTNIQNASMHSLPATQESKLHNETPGTSINKQTSIDKVASHEHTDKQPRGVKHGSFSANEEPSNNPSVLSHNLPRSMNRQTTVAKRQTI